LPHWQEGVALLRFSERHEGALAVAHLMKVSTSTEMKTWNGLIKPEESKTRTHADILRDRTEITHILQFMNSYEMGKSMPCRILFLLCYLIIFIISALFLTLRRLSGATSVPPY
jgi:hypothetical protein